MSTRETDFVQIIADEYGSDDPRMVFADWLLEAGHDQRAELIRVQCALARAERMPRTPEVNLLYDRQTFLQRFMNAQLAEVGSHLPRGVGLRFERGLVQTVNIAEAAFASSAGAILEHVPFFMKLEVRRQLGSDLRSVVAVPELRRARSLRIDAEDAPMSASDIGLLLDAFQTAPLYGLDIRQERLSDDAVSVLASHPACGQLRDLALTTISEVGASALAESKALAGLEKVLFYRIGRARGAKALATAKWLDSVRWFTLHKKALDDKSLDQLRQRLGGRLHLYPIAT